MSGCTLGWCPQRVTLKHRNALKQRKSFIEFRSPFLIQCLVFFPAWSCIPLNWPVAAKLCTTCTLFSNKNLAILRKFCLNLYCPGEPSVHSNARMNSVINTCDTRYYTIMHCALIHIPLGIIMHSVNGRYRNLPVPNRKLLAWKFAFVICHDLL